MKCLDCHFDNRSDARYCKKCGSALKLDCPSCGSISESDSLFCDECGAKLQIAVAPVTSDYSRPISYTPKFLADKILNIRSSIEGERAVVTVLFADVAEYTAMAAKLDPEEVHQIMDGCFRILMDQIHTYEGTINQFTGDGVMALFGAPIAHENHAQRSCYAALAIQRSMAAYGKQIKASHGLDFKMRAGINTGLVIVGSIGDDLRMDYTAIGDTTNLAKRMETIAKPGSVIVAEDTHRLVKSYFEFGPLTRVLVKGKEKPQPAYPLLGSSKVRTRFEASVSRGLIKFVGRLNSMGTIANTWNRAMEGHGQVLGIMGEAGVGKSRLVLQFTRSIFKKGFNVLEGQCVPHGQSTAYLPFLDIIKSYFKIQEGLSATEIKEKIKRKVDRPGRALPSKFEPAVQQLLSLNVDDHSWNAIEPQKRRMHIFEALKGLFIQLSRAKPLTIVIDDMQWVDKTSEEFLDFFIDPLSQTAILLILLYRPEYDHPWENKFHYNKLGLGHLTEKSSAELISAILADGAASVELEKLILRQSAGNPLFIEEFINNLLDNKYIERKENQFVLKQPVDDIKIPDSIQGIVTDRLNRLDTRIKDLMQIASVIGHDFRFRILQAVSGIGEDLIILLDHLQGLEFIYQKDLFPDIEYSFKHALVQDVTYESLLLRKRKKIHAQIGSTIEQLYADKLDEFYEILAHHYSCSQLPSKAYRYLKLSGEKARTNYSHLEAFNFFERAIEMYERLPDDQKSNQEKLAILNLMRRPIAMLGNPKGSLKMLTEGVKMAKQVGDRKAVARYFNDISILHTVRGDSLKSISSREQSFKEAVKIQDIDIMAPVALSLSYAYASSCNYKKLIAVTSTVVSLIEKTGRELDFFKTPFNLFSFFMALCGMAMAMCGDFARGRLMCDKGLRHAVKAGHMLTLAFDELQYANLLALKGDGRNAIAHCRNSIRYSEKTEWPTILGQAWTILGYAHYLIGELDQAREYAARGLRIQKDSGIEAMLSLPYWIFAMIHYDFGDLDQALLCAEKSLQLARKNHEVRYEGLSKIWIGRILSHTSRSQYAEAEKFILDGNEILEYLDVRPSMAQGYFYLGKIYLDAGDRNRGMEKIRKALSLFSEMGMKYWLDKAQAALNN